jgi:hypothetical protein
VFDGVAVGSWGRKASFAVRAAAFNCLGVDSQTARVNASKPRVGSGMPVNCARDIDNSPGAADNWFEATSMQVGTTNILVGVAAIGS